MTERSRTRILLTVCVPHSAGTGIIESLGALGAAQAPPALRATLDQILTCAAPHGPQRPPAASNALQSALASAGTPATISYEVVAGHARLSTLLQAADEAGAATCTIVAWTTPSAVAAATSRPARALALANWEMTLHAALRACEGRACVILPPESSRRRDAVLAQCVTGSQAPDVAPHAASTSSTPGASTRPADGAVPGEHPDILPSQRALAHGLVALEGPHDHLAAALPSMSAWTTALADADRRARAAADDAAAAWGEVRASALSADVLWTALWRTSLELADAVDEVLARDRRRREEGDVARLGPNPLSSP